MAFSALFVGPELNLEFHQSSDAIAVRQYHIKYDGGEDVVSHYITVDKGVVDASHPSQWLRFSDQFTLAENRAANPVGGPTRSVTVTILTQNADGVWTTLAEDILTGTVVNPAPVLTATPLVASTLGGVDIQIIEPSDSDLAGYRVHMGTTSDFTPTGTGVPGDGTCVYDGISPSFSVLIPDDEIRYFKIETRDAFGYAGVYYTGTTVSGARLNPLEWVGDIVDPMIATATDAISDGLTDLDTRLSGAVATLEATVDTAGTGLSARTVSLETVTADLTSNKADASRVSALEVSVNTAGTGLTARTGTLETATANLATNKADASRVTSLEATVDAPTGGVSNLGSRLTTVETVTTDGTFSTAARSTALEAQMAGTTTSGLRSRLVTVENVTTNGTFATASSVTSLSSTVGTHTSSISSLTSTTAGLTTGANAKVGLVLNVNGKISGYASTNDGTTSTFDVQADKFRVTDGASAVAPFVIDGGVVYIDNARIKDLTVNKLTTGTLNAQINMGTGKIVFDTGAVMKVQGLGFGTTSQFIEWFGPTMAITSCSEANGTQWLKLNGDAYFGGSLSAGTLTTKASTSSLATNAEAETATYGSNGGTINITVSYNWTATSSVSGYNPRPANSSGSNSATVKLYRSLAGAAYVEVATLSATGSWSKNYYDQGSEPGVPNWTGNWYSGCGGSITYTDPTTSTATRKYKAVMTATSLQSGTTQSQTVSVISVE